MENTKIFCLRCGTELTNLPDDDCWSTAFHVPFDTLLKLKKLMKNQCLCPKCLNIELEKIK